MPGLFGKRFVEKRRPEYIHFKQTFLDANQESADNGYQISLWTKKVGFGKIGYAVCRIFFPIECLRVRIVRLIILPITFSSRRFIEIIVVSFTPS